MMRMILAAILVGVSCYGQTVSVVPRTNNTGTIGTSDKQWSTGYFGNVIVSSQPITSLLAAAKVTSLNGVTGSVDVVGGAGVNVMATNGQVLVSLAQYPSTGIGTNRVYFRYSGYTNYWTVPAGITNIAVWAWGGAGGIGLSAGGSGGFSYGTFTVQPTNVLSIIVGQGGPTVTASVDGAVSPSAFPNGGVAVTKGQNGGGGGGSSHIFNTTNLLVVAGGGGGGSATVGNSCQGGNGGGVSGGNSIQYNPGGQLILGYGGTQTNGGAAGVTAGQIIQYTNTPGSYLQGGNAGLATNSTQCAGGGGGGYYGGGGAFAFNLNHAGGGAGSGYINPVIGVGITIRGLSSNPAGQELPEYLTNIGVPSNNNGLIVIGY